MKIKKSVLILNTFLVLAIVAILVLTIYKKEVQFDCSFDAAPVKLLDIINRKFTGTSIKDVAVFFVFNQLPSKSDIQTIEKLHFKFKEKVTVLTLFLRKFKYDQEMRFPHRFLSNLKIKGKSKENNKIAEDNYFLVLKNKKVQYIDKKLDLVNMAFLIQKKLNPRLGYRDFALSSENLRKKISRRLDKGNLRLLRLSSNREEILKDVTEISRVYFIHAACSTCQLKSLFAKLKLDQIMADDEKHIIVFSVFADSFKLNAISGEGNLNVPAYLDVNDEFDLFSTITNDKENPLIIDLKNKENQ